MRGFAVYATADGNADIDFKTKCEDTPAVNLAALIVLLRTFKTSWRGDRRLGIDMSFLMMGGTQDDIRRTLETDIGEQASRVAGFSLESVSVTPPRVDNGSRLWGILLVGTVAGSLQPLSVSDFLSV